MPGSLRARPDQDTKNHDLYVTMTRFFFHRAVFFSRDLMCTGTPMKGRNEGAIMVLFLEAVCKRTHSAD